jgi:hypothetical protein
MPQAVANRRALGFFRAGYISTKAEILHPWSSKRNTSTVC